MMTESDYAVKVLEKLRKGGRKGGKARAKNLSARQLSNAGRKAVNARWSKTKKRKSS